METFYSSGLMFKDMFRVGFSKDIHRLIKGRKFILGGIEIPFEYGEQAHSDGDVVFHALAESILGALALGDLGKHYPDNDPKYKDINSEYIVLDTVKKMKEKGYKVHNVDIFVSLEKPKLSPYISEMRNNIARLLQIDIDYVSIKAGTNEGMGEVGQGLAVEAYSYILLERSENN